MSHVAILIAMFTAAQHPTPKNCSAAGNALVDQAILDTHIKGEPIHADEDLELIKQFLTKTCKDGVKRK